MSTLDPATAVMQARSALARATTGYASWLDPDAAARHDSLVTAIYLDHPQRAISEHRSPVVLEVSDVAPVPVRDRIRARVRLFGTAAASQQTTHGIHIQPTHVHLDTGGATIALDPVDLWRAEPDPLALAEAGLLGHLDSCHPDTMEMLARLVPDEFRAQAGRIAPVALDRGGIVLRVEHTSGHIDVRLHFARNLTHACEAADALAALLRSGEAPAPVARGARRRSPLAALMDAGPAATRICAPTIPATPGTRGPAR